MPEPQFTNADYTNPDAPEEDRRLRPDHPRVPDMSYDRSRSRQMLDLFKRLFFDPGHPDDETVQAAEKSGVWPPRLEIYIKETPRGPGYVADFLYLSHDLPVAVYGVLLSEGRGLTVGGLELWRPSWGYFDEWGDFVGKDQWEAENTTRGEAAETKKFTGITTTILRQIPLGDIVARAQRVLANQDWEDEGITVLMGPDIPADQLTPGARTALESRVNAATAAREAGRPPLPDSQLVEVAHAYLEESARGPGLRRRLATRFDRPESTVRDWISEARRRGFLSAATPGRRGASAGPRLPLSPRHSDD